MFADFVLWAMMLLGLSGASLAVWGRYGWKPPARAALLITCGMLVACALGCIWGAATAVPVRALCAAGVVVAGAAAVWLGAGISGRADPAEPVAEAVVTPPGRALIAARVREGTEAVRAAAERVTQALAEAGSDQSAGVLEVSGMLEEMNEAIQGIAENTATLSESAEESASSILEMGATVEEVGGSMQALGGSAEECVASIGQMASAIREVARNVEGLSGVAEETNAAMEEMATTIRQVEDNAADSRQLSLEVVSAAEQGRERVAATISGIEAIRSASEDAQKVILSLGLRVREIGEILDVIDEVADETNLLALNAAIIAAQAGEHGRGFSVVADQIKDLADRVATSTKEIGRLIKAVQDESANAVGAVKEGAQMVAEGVRLSNEAGGALQRITERAERSGEMIGEIANATTEQSKGAASVVVAMERVRGMVSEIRTAMEEQTRGSELVMNASSSMRDLAHQVSGMVQEQGGASKRITVNIEDIREMVQRIDRAMQDQRIGAAQAVTALERLSGKSGGRTGALGMLESTVRDLLARAERLTEMAEDSAP